MDSSMGISELALIYVFITPGREEVAQVTWEGNFKANFVVLEATQLAIH